jgi:hypothetical protein
MLLKKKVFVFYEVNKQQINEEAEVGILYWNGMEVGK